MTKKSKNPERRTGFYPPALVILVAISGAGFLMFEGLNAQLLWVGTGVVTLIVGWLVRRFIGIERLDTVLPPLQFWDKRFLSRPIIKWFAVIFMLIGTSLLLEIARGSPAEPATDPFPWWVFLFGGLLIVSITYGGVLFLFGAPLALGEPPLTEIVERNDKGWHPFYLFVGSFYLLLTTAVIWLWLNYIVFGDILR